MCSVYFRREILPNWISVELRPEEGKVRVMHCQPGGAHVHRRGIVHCSSGWGGQDRDHNIPVQILKIDNTMTLSLSLTSLSLLVNSELLSLTWNMGFFVCDLSYCKKSSRGFLGWPRRAPASAVAARRFPNLKKFGQAAEPPLPGRGIWCINASAS